MKSGVGRHARYCEQPEQPLERLGLFAFEPVKHALQRAARDLRLVHRHAVPEAHAIMPRGATRKTPSPQPMPISM
jgi:hypothetical protein